ncbi:unnamed protein product [Caenorhabditis auriculariae]|uniref:Exonuclease domain-containing protein n=1 Tax=Caenorhabditis auriculariae TaxID=2777116 RepID=A0A8S1HNY2_9PELO|nr:unnamed protein product [Caenorhabditis auriculariae]
MYYNNFNPVTTPMMNPSIYEPIDPLEAAVRGIVPLGVRTSTDGGNGYSAAAEPTASTSEGEARSPAPRQSTVETIRSLPLPKTVSKLPEANSREEYLRENIQQLVNIDKLIHKLHNQREEIIKKAAENVLGTDSQRVMIIKKEVAEESGSSAPQSFASMLNSKPSTGELPKNSEKAKKKSIKCEPIYEEYIPTRETGSVEDMRKEMGDVVNAEKDRIRQKASEKVSVRSSGSVDQISDTEKEKRLKKNKVKSEVHPAEDQYMEYVPQPISKRARSPDMKPEKSALLSRKKEDQLDGKRKKKKKSIDLIDLCDDDSPLRNLVPDEQWYGKQEPSSRHKTPVAPCKPVRKFEFDSDIAGDVAPVYTPNPIVPPQKKKEKVFRSTSKPHYFDDDDARPAKVDRKRKSPQSEDAPAKIKIPKENGAASSSSSHSSLSTSSSRRIAHEAPTPIPVYRSEILKPRKMIPTLNEQLNRTMQAATKKPAEPPQKIQKKPPTQEQLYGVSQNRIGSTSKGEQRVARTFQPVSLKSIKKEPEDSPRTKVAKAAKEAPPGLLDPMNSKVPMTVRMPYLKKIFEHCVKNDVPNPAARAQKEEKEVVDKVKNRLGYPAAVVAAINKIRKEVNGDDVLYVAKNAVSHDQVLAGRHYGNVSVGIRNKRITSVSVEKMSDQELLNIISTFTVSMDALKENGYPMQDSELPNKAIIAATEYDKNKKPWVTESDLLRTCSRCNQEFRLPEDGVVVKRPEICRYHTRGVSVQGKRQTFSKSHACCGMELNLAPGCKFASHHVFDSISVNELNKFYATPRPSGANDPRSSKVYALDCEMVYTMAGPALARLSVVDLRGKHVLDVKVRPQSELIDANTEFSGLHEKDVISAPDTMQSCREKFFRLVNAETILVGHSLESDLKALRMMHNRIVDTALLFPNTRNGKKMSLRYLSSEHLQRFIQQDVADMEGHDSFEDAKTCMDLVFFKIRNPVTAS